MSKLAQNPKFAQQFLGPDVRVTNFERNVASVREQVSREVDGAQPSTSQLTQGFIPWGSAYVLGNSGSHRGTTHHSFTTYSRRPRDSDLH